jgi:antitoxin (DNA-binding transcriptional repressor) of toxin-antitoxin stability system
MSLVADVNDLPARLDEVLKSVRSGNEVVVVDEDQMVAKIIPFNGPITHPPKTLKFTTFPDVQVRTPVIHKSEIADELFSE